MGAFDGGAETRKHVIVSHGGKHGGGGTFLRGAAVPPEVARQLPVDLIMPLDPARAAQFAVPDAPAAPAPALGPSPAPPQLPPPAPARPTVTLPSNVRELHLLKKDELVILASELGVKIEGEPTVVFLRETLKTQLGL